MPVGWKFRIQVDCPMTGEEDGNEENETVPTPKNGVVNGKMSLELEVEWIPPKKESLRKRAGIRRRGWTSAASLCSGRVARKSKKQKRTKRHQDQTDGHEDERS